MKQPVFRAYLLGFLVPFCAGLVLAASSVHDPSLGAWGHITRALDSFSAHLLAFALFCVVLLFVLRARWIGSILLALILIVAVPLVQQHLAMTQPLASDKDPNLRIIWFNMFATNATPLERIVDRAVSDQADIIVLAESKQFEDNRDLLTDRYPYQLGCVEICEVLTFSRLPMADSALKPLVGLHKERLASFNITPQNGQSITITTAHMRKPWYLGLAEQEDHFLDKILRRQSGPQILVGDFNAAPWSRRIKLRLNRSGLKGLQVPVSTWPASLGRFGIPIDQVFVGGGIQFVSVSQWGHDLGSNHLGLLIDLYVPPAQTQ